MLGGMLAQFVLFGKLLFLTPKDRGVLETVRWGGHIQPNVCMDKHINIHVRSRDKQSLATQGACWIGLQDGSVAIIIFVSVSEVY